MSDEFSINRVDSNLARQEFNFQVVQAVQNEAMAEAAKTVREPEKQSEVKQQEEEARKQQQKQQMFKISHTELQFEIDQDTSEITLKIIDRDTKEILRTIPQRSFSDLSVAELFELST